MMYTLCELTQYTVSRSGIFLHISCDISSYKGSISMLALTKSKENDKLCN